MPEGDPSDHSRERFLVHTENPACGGCHRLMDPIGFGFDHYAENGLWHSVIEEETGGIIRQFEGRVLGELVETTDIDGVFDGASELQSKLASGVDAKRCYVFNGCGLRKAIHRVLKAPFVTIAQNQKEARESGSVI